VSSFLTGHQHKIGLFAFLSHVFALVIVPDCVVFYNSKFAFRDGFISYVYKHVCERTNRVVSTKNGFDTEQRINFVGESIPICFRKASSCCLFDIEKLCHMLSL